MLRRDVVSLDPALHRRVISMAELAGHRANAAALADQFCVACHTPDVRVLRTHVNVESVCPVGDKPYVAEKETTGEALSRLRQRADISVRDLANGAGYNTGSGVQRFLEASYDKRLTPDIAERLANALVGKGAPPIAREEVLALTGMPVAANAAPFQMEGASAERMRRDVPVYGTALGADEIVDGEAIEQTTLNTSEVIGYLRRPVLLDGRADVYGLYVQGSSMSPRHHDGATLFVEGRRQPRIGDDAVVYLRAPDFHDGERPSSVLVKTLKRKTAAFIELEQYSPPLTFRISTERVERMDRVIPWDELVA